MTDTSVPTPPTEAVAGGLPETRSTPLPGAVVADTADVDPRAELGDGTRVWHLAAVREGAQVGSECNIGRGAYVGPGVVMGDRCKLQNAALVYEPAVLEAGVFVGPGAVLTNDVHPRSVTPEGRLKNEDDWDAVGVTLREGASIGARAVCVAPVQVGRWAMVAAGAVVVADVPDFALMVGMPARQVGWVGHVGVRLVPDEDGWRCPRSGRFYVESSSGLELAHRA